MSKTTKVVTSVVVVILLAISLVVFYFYNNGFKILTYATENYVEEQIQDILNSESGENYEGKIEELTFKEFGDEYVGFFYINDTDENQCLIAKYKNDFNLGENKVLNLNRVIKGDGSVAMMQLESSYVILASNEDEKFEGINILSDAGEVIDTIELTDEGIEAKNGEKIDEKVYVIEYKPEEAQNVNIEVVMKSEE